MGRVAPNPQNFLGNAPLLPQKFEQKGGEKEKKR